MKDTKCFRCGKTFKCTKDCTHKPFTFLPENSELETVCICLDCRIEDYLELRSKAWALQRGKTPSFLEYSFFIKGCVSCYNIPEEEVKKRILIDTL